MNYYWAVYKKNKLISLSPDKTEAQEMALKLSRYRWTFQTFKKDWKHLKTDGYKLLKVKIIPYDGEKVK